jgi:predicted nuclease of restriction endonuclease-like RecB superfamily
MLTRELAISKIIHREIVPDRLTRSTHAEYGLLAAHMVAIYEQGVGQTRSELHRQIREILVALPNCPPKRIDAFCKLLDERCDYVTDSKGASANLRLEVFRLASQYQPITLEQRGQLGSLEAEAKSRIATALGRPWPEIAEQMFLDLPENHRLKAFRSFEQPMGLLARYNVAQTQVVFYDALKLEIRARDDLKEIIRFAKLARLMHRITREGDGYLIQLDGPASLLQRTSRYGVAMARFLPGLLSCKGWSAQAAIKRPRWGGLSFRLDDSCGLQSEVVPAQEFDSKLEEDFYRDWKELDNRDWHLLRESRILHAGQQVFIPDFEAIHKSGRRVLIEIVGFWTPEYLSHKMRVLGQFKDQLIVLLVHSTASAKVASMGSHRVLHRVIEYKSKIVISKLLAILEEVRGSVS